MNDDLLARAESRLMDFKQGAGLKGSDMVFIGELRAALRARDTDLATARTVTRRLLDSIDSSARRAVQRGELHGIPISHIKPDPPELAAVRAWLASVSPPASGEEP